jgi:hypothetical protein
MGHKRFNALVVVALLTPGVGALFAGGATYAATEWVVGLGAGPTGEAGPGMVTNLRLTAVATPLVTNVLYPGGTSDVVLTISNENAFPVTITAVNLPTNTTYATGYTTGALTTTRTGCLAVSPSDVIWNQSTRQMGSSHALRTALTVAARGHADNPLTARFNNAARMTSSAPASCENTYFVMPALTGVVATSRAAPVTTSPATDSWTA